MATHPSEPHDWDAAQTRPLFRPADVIVLVVLLLLLAGLMLPASAKVRQAAIRLSCANNLKQIGLAIHDYENAFNALPNPDVPTESATDRLPVPGARAGWGTHTIYADLLPYVGEASLAKSWQTDPRLVKTYTCPARRIIDPTADVRVKAPDDYATGMHPDWFAEQTTPGLKGNPATNGYPAPSAGARLGGTAGWFSILGGQWTREASGLGGRKERLFAGTSLADVSDMDGTSNTLLMAHKGLAPAQYAGGSPTDLGWNVLGPASRAVQYEHMRCPFGAVQDFNGNKTVVPFCDWSAGFSPSSSNSMDWLIGSPHAGTMPCLFADCSVRGIAYGSPTDAPRGAPGGIHPHLWAKLWAFNDGLPIDGSRYMDTGAPGKVVTPPERVTRRLFDLPLSVMLIFCALIALLVVSLRIIVNIFMWIRQRRRLGNAPSG